MESIYMKKYSRNDLEKGLDCYNPEARVFPNIAAKINNKQRVDAWDVLLILKWKLSRLKDSNSVTVADRNMDVINDAIRDAGENDGKDALSALMTVPGIGLAVATSILTVCYPAKFTIIDQRVLEELNLFPSKLSAIKQENGIYSADDWTADDYLNEYLPKIKEYSKALACDLRTIDRVLWGLSVNRRIEKLIENS